MKAFIPYLLITAFLVYIPFQICLGSEIHLLILNSNNTISTSKYINVEWYQYRRKKKIDYIEFSFSNNTKKIISIENVFGLIFFDDLCDNIDTLLLIKGLFSTLEFKQVQGNIRKHAIFVREYEIFAFSGLIGWDTWYLITNKQVIKLRVPLITQFGIPRRVFFSDTRNQKRSLAIAK